MTSNPIIGMTHGRAEIWKNQATDDDFMKQLSDLANIYAGRKREESHETGAEYEEIDAMKLFKDYKEWLVDNG